MKYRVMRVDNLVYDINERIQKKYFPTIPKAAIANEMLFRFFKQEFATEVEEAKQAREQENQCDQCDAPYVQVVIVRPYTE